MKYTPPSDDLLVAITYGSHLYGTSTPTSDHDFKAISLPPYRDLVLAKPLKVERYRFDVSGNPVGHNTTMPDNGYEAEHTPVQKFVHDFLSGQAYAVETVFAVLQGAHEKHMGPPGSVSARRAAHFVTLCGYLATEFVHRNVQGMVGFAMKQTFDYVRRGERLNLAKEVLTVLNEILAPTAFEASSIRLDTVWEHRDLDVTDKTAVETLTVLDEIVKRTGLEIGSAENNNKKIRTLKLNGREYLETTTLVHLQNAVQKLVSQYGDRSSAAAETDVDWKSLSHAMRVYQQVIEYLQTGFIVFPRPNTDDLLQIKQGKQPLEEVKDRLRSLDDHVQEMMASSELPEVDEAFRARVDDMLFNWLHTLYQPENSELKP